MKLAFAFCAALLIAAPALAGGNTITNTHNKGGGGTSTSSASSTATAKGGTATGGSASSTAEGGAGAGTATSGPLSVDTHNPRQALAPALGALPGGPCTGPSGGLSLGLPIFGGGLAGAVVDGQCTLRANIVIVAQFSSLLAAEMLEDLDGVKEAKARLMGKLSGSTAAPGGDSPATAPRAPREGR